LSTAAISEQLGPAGKLRFRHDQLCGEGAAEHRLRWMEVMHSHGISVVEGVPLEEQAIVSFAEEQVGYIWPTSYGYTFTIKAVENPNNLAYSSGGLQQHTDLPFYSTPPGVQLFHCLQQAEEGGDSLFLDGFGTANDLFASDERAFRELCGRQVRFFDLTDLWHLSAKHPTILVDETNDSSGGMPALRRICFNERTRDSWRDWKIGAIDQDARFYHSLRSFEELVEQRQRYVIVRLKPGEMVCVDNWRVMHSRLGFSGARHFIGGYVGWDAIYARWRASGGRPTTVFG